MYDPKEEYRKIEQAIQCLTDLSYEAVKCVADMSEENADVVIESCNSAFESYGIGFRVISKNGYFERIEK